VVVQIYKLNLSIKNYHPVRSNRGRSATFLDIASTPPGKEG